MENVHSSDGIAEDIIRSFVQFGSAEMHLKTLVEKTASKIDNPKEDEDEGVLLEQMDAYIREMETVAQLRRDAMRQLFTMYNGNKDVWCLVKHLGIGSMQMFEAYQASDNDPFLFDLWYRSNQAFIGALCKFIGKEITECAACFADMLKEK